MAAVSLPRFLYTLAYPPSHRNVLGRAVMGALWGASLWTHASAQEPSVVQKLLGQRGFGATHAGAPNTQSWLNQLMGPFQTYTLTYNWPNEASSSRMVQAHMVGQLDLNEVLWCHYVGNGDEDHHPKFQINGLLSPHPHLLRQVPTKRPLMRVTNTFCAPDDHLDNVQCSWSAQMEALYPNQTFQYIFRAQFFLRDLTLKILDDRNQNDMGLWGAVPMTLYGSSGDDQPEYRAPYVCLYEMGLASLIPLKNSVAKGNSL